MDIMSLFRFSLRCYDVGLYVKETISKIRYKKWNDLAKCNARLREYKTSDTCFICGNGPSLKKVNLDELDGDTIVMNDFWRIATNYKKIPTYYIINDNVYALPSLKEKAEGVLTCCPEIPHVLSVYMGPAMEKMYSSFNTNIFYFNNIGRTYKSKYKIDFTKCTYYTWNVVTAAIQLAIYLGYNNIYLLGCDYSLFASKYLQHAYDKDGQKVPCPFLLRDMLYKYSFTTHIHYEVAKYAKEHGFNVVNMTNASLLDAYEFCQDSNY